MKLIYKTVIFLSFAAWGLSSLEARSFDFFLDHKAKETFHLQSEIPELIQESPFASSSPSFYCQQLKIENLGNYPIKNFFPYVNGSPSLSLEDLAKKLSKEQYPLLALYQLWNRSVLREESLTDVNKHPLDLLNFQGACSSTAFKQQFINLCNALGIETRLANVRGQQLYDFGIDDEWNFLDLNNHQIYLSLNNEQLVSSEEVMDDPFLALRTKHSRQDEKMNFKDGWKQLANFEIIEPASAMPVLQDIEKLETRSNGFDLFPGEVLLFETSAIRSNLASYECALEHTVQLEARHISFHWEYLSPFPLRHLINQSTANIFLVDQQIKLQPGEAFEFKKEVFHVNITFDSPPQGKLVFSGICAWSLFPALTKGKNQIHLGIKKNPSIIRFHYETNDALEKEKMPSLQVCNPKQTFDYCSPYFEIKSSLGNVEKIWWQIALDNQFQLIPSNLDQVESFQPNITLSQISETFLSPGSTYYFRVKGCRNGQWSEWSTPHAFSVNKPAAVEEVLFEEIDENEYELNWERYAERSDEPIEYLVFGSNSLDFIPSIYCDKQVNAIVNGEVTEEESNDNLIAITTEPKMRVQGSLAYYRIIAKQRGQLSVPSTIIHVYDQELIQPRNVLQVMEDDSQLVAKRMLFPAAYPWTETSLPLISESARQGHSLIKLQSLLRSATELKVNHSKYHYEFPKVSDDIWEEVRPYLLPENHPAWPKLHRVFCKTRATQSTEHFKKAGFRRWRPGRWSRVSASALPGGEDYFIKAYCDTEAGIIYDWKKWIHRIKGAETIRKCIKDYNLQSRFKVPHKWIYPLPKNPSPPKTSQYVRKNFILVCENMRIQDHKTNEKLYKNKITQSLMNGLYTILQVCGLYDSVYVFNMPFCKDGRIAIIDTEYHHKWPVPFHKLNTKFPKNLQSYWKKITFKGGKIPDGVNQYNPPRMDRRDVRR